LTIAAIINANIFGNMAVLLAGLGRKSAQFQENLDTANTAMKNMKLPEDLQLKVISFIISTRSTSDNQNELDQFLHLLSPSLKLAVIKEIFVKVLSGNKIFQENDDLFELVVRKLNLILFQPEDEITRHGE
jgi:hypothetical protein